jgi:hypothetical protein
MSTNVSSSVRNEQRTGTADRDVRILTEYGAFCFESRMLGIESTTLISQGGQNQTREPFELSVKTTQEPACFAQRSDCLQAYGPSRTQIKPKRKFMINNKSRSTDLLMSLKMRRVDWRHVQKLIFLSMHLKNKTEVSLQMGDGKRIPGQEHA